MKQGRFADRMARALGAKSSRSEVETAVSPSAIDSLESQCNSIVRDIGVSTNFSIGLINLGIDPVSIQPLVEALAVRSNRTTYCIQSGPPTFSSRAMDVSENAASDVHVFYDAWNLQDPSGAQTSMLTGIRQLPVLKSRFPLIAFDLGNFDSEWIEPLGRLCDAVYVMIPERGALSPSQSVAQTSKWIQAGLRIRGTWIARAA